jgi:hypothetical protein
VLIEVFASPSGRLADNLSQLSAQFYSVIGPKLLNEGRGHAAKLFTDVANNDLKLMENGN